MNTPYDFHKIEAEAQAFWQQHGSFAASEKPSGEKFYCLSMFPYPSGHLHMGHVRCYTLSDVIARYQRLAGKQVLHPMGWDAFGLPAENAAIKHDTPPARWTSNNIASMRGQLEALGISFDWKREFATCDPGYYGWEQWFFTRLLASGLVYRKSSWVNWDPVDCTVLSNEQVIEGRGWRSGALIERRKMAQWFLRITDYAEELLHDLDHLPGWPEQVKHMQRNWIGRSEGVNIRFDAQDGEDCLEVFTTRPDTLMGVTFMAVSPEHPWAAQEAKTRPELARFIHECRNVKMAEADLSTQEKTGLPLRRRVRHPLTGAEIPVWTANFILMEYGFGAAMCVPGHDQRDWEFAHRYHLPIVEVIAPADDSIHDLTTSAFTGKGRLVNSPGFDGLSSSDAGDAIAKALEKSGKGGRQVQYRLRDWSVSRQRYWGCPIPIVHCDDCGVVPVPDEQLPVLLPENAKFEGIKSPLTTMESFYRCNCPKCDRPAVRETDTFDTFMESSWYYARFACADNDTAMLDARAARWTPVDMYVGGIEHAVLHLLYARFYHKVMRDHHVGGAPLSSEPFTNLLLIGMVLKDGRKMSKSSGTTTDPQQLMDTWGSDAVRLAIIFASPPEQSFEWSEHGVEAAHRFLRRLWNLVDNHLARFKQPPEEDPADCAARSQAARNLRRRTHETLLRGKTDYSQRLSFNTVVSGAMSLCNDIARFATGEQPAASVIREALEVTVQILSPIVPHICHALWKRLGHEEAVAESRLMPIDENALARDRINMAVQVNGKRRAQITVEAEADETTIRTVALADDNVQRFVNGKTIRRVIYVPGSLVNLVVT